MPAAIARAVELGLLYDVKNPVHKWVIAMLHPKTQFSDPVMQAILKLDFDGMLGVVTLSRITHKTFHTPELLKPSKVRHVYQFFSFDQRTVLPEAIVAIGVLFESASPAPSLDDPAFCAILTKQAEDQVALNMIEGSRSSERKGRRPQAAAAIHPVLIWPLSTGNLAASSALR